MKGLKEVSKDIILAGLGSIDSQNEEIKDLLRRGEAVLGMGHVENEELRWNGNKDKLDKKTDENGAECVTKGIQITIEKTKEVNG